MRLTTTITLLSTAILLQSKPVISQSFQDAGEYMNHISDANEKLSAVYMSYMSAIAHKNARKQEKRRQDVVSAIYNTKLSIFGMPPWKGDKSFRDTSVAYLKILNTVFHEDYSKIVNMEEIAEQSYDAMEAYLLAEEKAWAKLGEAATRQHEMSKVFAERYGVQLIQGESETSKKSRVAAELNKHNNEVYLIFFKPYKQEMYLLEALQKGNLIAIEQNMNSLEKFSDQGMEKLKGMKGFKNDPTLVIACREMLNFYKSEAQQSKALTDFFLKKESFEKMKKSFETKRNNDRTPKDIDEYNKGVADINIAAKEYNKLNDQLNKGRSEALDNWNKKSSRYMDDYMPVQKKQ